MNKQLIVFCVKSILSKFLIKFLLTIITKMLNNIFIRFYIFVKSQWIVNNQLKLHWRFHRNSKKSISNENDEAFNENKFIIHDNIHVFFLQCMIINSIESWHKILKNQTKNKKSITQFNFVDVAIHIMKIIDQWKQQNHDLIIKLRIICIVECIDYSKLIFFWNQCSF